MGIEFKTKKQKDRYRKLVPNGKLRYIRCYDNGGESADRYTVVFTGHYKFNGERCFIGMSGNPFHPLGIGMIGESHTNIDYPTYSHLGKRIKFDDLTEKGQEYVMQTYLWLWDFTNDEGKVLN